MIVVVTICVDAVIVTLCAATVINVSCTEVVIMTTFVGGCDRDALFWDRNQVSLFWTSHHDTVL